MGLRRGEINGLKYSDIELYQRHNNGTAPVRKKLKSRKEDFAPKTFTKREVSLKTDSSYRALPIPDYVFEAVLKQRKWYERMYRRIRKQRTNSGKICWRLQQIQANIWERHLRFCIRTAGIILRKIMLINAGTNVRENSGQTDGTMLYYKKFSLHAVHMVLYWIMV